MGGAIRMYYATNFMFTPVRRPSPFMRGCSYGGEGQAMLGGLGVGARCLYISRGQLVAGAFLVPLRMAVFFLLPHWARFPRSAKQSAAAISVNSQRSCSNFICRRGTELYLVQHAAPPRQGWDPATARFPDATKTANVCTNTLIYSSALGGRDRSFSRRKGTALSRCSAGALSRLLAGSLHVGV